MSAAQKIGRYEIERELGQGGMAIVYLARDPAMNRQVAIKVLPRQFTFDPQFRARFQREAEVIAKLEHPHIVPIYDFGEEEGQPYIVMRYMPGGSLLDRMKQRFLGLSEIIHVVERVAQALDEAHAKHIIHRDLKPGNILFDTRGEAFLSDFGIAKLTEGAPTFTGTSTGIMGTPAYMSPEQARGIKDLDGRSDVYALGIILFEMLTGRLPYESDTPMGMAVAHITEPVPSILTVKPDLPPICTTLITRSLAKDPAQRYPTAGALARDVKLLMETDVAETVRAESFVSHDLPPIPTAPGAGSTPAAATPPGVGTIPPSGMLLPTVSARSTSSRVWIAAIVIVVFLCGMLALGGGVLVILQRPKNTATALPTARSTSVPAITPEVTPSAPPPQAITATASPIPTIPPTVAPPTDTPPPPTAIPSPTPAALTGHIVFVSYRDKDEEIYIMNADGSNQTRLTNSPLGDTEPVLGPDGRLIVFVSQRAGGHKLFIMNADGSNPHQLTDGKSDAEFDPYFSPDGQWIAYSSSRGSRFELWLIHPDGTGLTQLTSGPNSKNFPAWSPDGQWIAYNSKDNDQDVIKILRPDGTEDRIVLRLDEAYVSGWIGGRILFVAKVGATTDIYSANPDGSDMRQLTYDLANDKGPFGTPDGRFILFNSARDRNDEIYVMNADGSNPTRLTFSPGNDYQATCGP